MEQQNLPLSEEVQSPSISSYLFFFLLAILPVVISVVIHIRLGPEDYLRASAELKGLIHNWFGFAPIGDTTHFLVITREIRLLEVLHSFVCMIGGAIILGVTIKGKKKSLIFMTIPYTLLTLISMIYFFMSLSIAAGAFSFYNRFYLLFFDISVLHGPLPIILYSAIVIGFFVYLWAELKKRGKSKVE